MAALNYILSGSDKFERWNLRQRPERRRAGRPESFTTVQCHERAKLCVPFTAPAAP
jgi:hypothetical protein